MPRTVSVPLIAVTHSCRPLGQEIKAIRHITSWFMTADTTGLSASIYDALARARECPTLLTFPIMEI